MRCSIVAIAAWFAFVGPVAADQTDPRLDQLFEDLRVGEAVDAEAAAGRIVDIWSDSQSDTVDVIFARAAKSADAGEFELASALLDNAIGLSPNFMQAYALRGAVRMQVQNQAGAMEDFSRALALEPRQFEVRIALAEILAGNGETRAAYDMLQKALEWNPHDDYARRRARKLRKSIDGQEI